MRIVHFLSGLDRGGAQRMVSTLVPEQADRHDVSIWLKCRKEHAFPVDPRVSVIEMSERGCLSLVRTILRLRGMIRARHPDLVVAHTNRNAPPAIVAGLLAGVPVVAVEHTVYRGLRSRQWRFLRTLTYPFAAAVVVLARDQIVRYRWCRVTMIPNPVALPESAPEPTVPVDRDERPLRLVFAGRLERVKGVDRLIEICSRLRIPFRLDIVGSGSEETAIRRMISSFRLEDSITLHGWQSNVSPYLESAEVVVITSRMEGFGLAVVEAMAHGCIPVAYRVEGGLSDIVHDGVNGMLVPDEDAVAFATALAEIRHDPELAPRLSRAAVKTARRYAPERIAGRWEELFHQLRTRRRHSA